MVEKSVVWVGSSQDDLRDFPELARRRVGYELHQVQLGLPPSDWEPLNTVGRGVGEIRVHVGGAFRLVYVAKFEEAIYVLHAEFTDSSGNVFEDLGFSKEEAENLKVRSVLMAGIRRIIEAQGITQAVAAERFGVTQPRISDLVRGKIELFSIDALINMLATAGHHVEISVAVDGDRAA